MIDHAAMNNVVLIMGSSSVRKGEGIWGQNLKQTRLEGSVAHPRLMQGQGQVKA